MPKMSTATKTQCRLEDLGLIDYDKAYELQRRYVDQVIKNTEGQRLLLCEHPPVITLGRNSHAEHILFSENVIKSSGGKIISIDRGGDVTLHVPGQIVAYPILDLNQQGRDLHRYLHGLEQVGIDLLGDFDIMAHRLKGKTGVYVQDKKIMSIGVGVRKWVSYHGLALNINVDLNYFRWIKPCGLDVVMTSLHILKKKTIEMREVKEKLAMHLGRIFKLDII